MLKATRIAARVARWLAAPMAITGVALGSVSLVVLAGFVWIMARAEQRFVEQGATQGRYDADPGALRVDGSGWMPPAYGSRFAGSGYVVRVGPNTYVRVTR